MSSFIVAAKRTVFGSFGGGLKHLSAVDLGVAASQAVVTKGVEIDATIFGNVIAAGRDAAYTARHIGLKSHAPVSSTALTLNRLCGSGLEALVQADMLIKLSQADVVLAGGTESMSQAPLSIDGHKARWGTPLGAGLVLSDSLWDGLTDQHAGTPMGVTAENLALKYDISRAECDAYAKQSQERFQAAQESGKLDAELVSIACKKKDVTKDEHPRPDTTLEKMASLKPVFKKDGVVTAANASGICDGAGALLIVSERALSKYNLTPLAKIKDYSITGCDPTIMGIGPVQCIRNILESSKLQLSDLSRVEINEAFAAQVLSCQKELGLSDVNVNGGAIAVGHPLGASGARIAAHLVNDRDSELSIASACIGGGQGIAVLLENV